ncbi:MAG: YutD family protein [Bacilli bacterium]|nr:YutD family protein [Bacilli bacterium]
MKKIVINDVEYEIVHNDDNCIDKEVLEEKITDYFDRFDYIFGDYAYEKVRLKGFYDSKNKEAKPINDIKKLEDYKNNYCSFGAKTFLLKKIK